jgi:hypothetical protein
MWHIKNQQLLIKSHFIQKQKGLSRLRRERRFVLSMKKRSFSTRRAGDDNDGVNVG